jgi:hypothetical protein
MLRRWHADSFGILRPWGEVPASLEVRHPPPPPALPEGVSGPSTGTSVVTFLMA